LIRLGESRVKVYDPRVADGIYHGDKNHVIKHLNRKYFYVKYF